MKNKSKGFSLVELLVGLAIGLMGLLAVSLVMLSFTKSRNTIAQGMTTQNNGVMALYRIEHDLSQAGYGLMHLQTCSFINYAYSGTGFYNTPYGTSNLPGVSNTALTTLPVRIIDGGTGSDILEVQYRGILNAGTTGQTSPVDSGIPGAEINGTQTAYSSDYPVTSAIGFAVGDFVVSNINNICTLGQVSGTNPVATPIPHTSGAYNVTVAPGGTGWNYTTSGDLTAVPRPYLANLGNFVSRRYVVAATTATSALTVAELPTFAANNLVDDIVVMKAQYGLTSSCAAGASPTVTSWVSGTTAINNTNACNVVAVRVGVVARSPIYEKDAVDGPTKFTVLPAISGTSTVADPASGQCATDTATKEVICVMSDTHYRYRVYSTIVPLKNVIWNY